MKLQLQVVALELCDRGGVIVEAERTYGVRRGTLTYWLANNEEVPEIGQVLTVTIDLDTPQGD